MTYPNQDQSQWPPPNGPPKTPGKTALKVGAGATTGILGGGCLFMSMLAFVALVFIGGCSALLVSAAGDDTKKPTTTAAEDVYAVGDTAHTGEFDVTVHTVTDPYTEEFIAPTAGRRFVAIEMTMTNTSAEPLPISTLFNDITDQNDRLGTVGFGSLATIDTPTAAPGEARRGWALYEVAEDATDLMLRVKGNLTATGSLFELGA